MAGILKILKYETQLHFDLRYEKIVPNVPKDTFHGDDVIDDVTQGDLKVGPLYTCWGEARAGSKWQGQCQYMRIS